MKTFHLALLLFSFPFLVFAAPNWPNQRGPHFNGSGGQDLKLPAQFSPTENVDWKAELPGASAATPVVWNDHVFVNAVDREKKEIHAICLQASTGKILWSRVVAKGRVRIDDRSDFSSPSPVTDGKHVAFFFGNGELIVYDMSGKEIWRKNMIPPGEKYFAFQWTFSTSPILFEGNLIMQVLQRDVPFSYAGLARGKQDANSIPSYLVAFDFATGEQKWRAERPAKAVAESLEAFTSPVVSPTADEGGKLQLLVAGGGRPEWARPGQRQGDLALGNMEPRQNRALAPGALPGGRERGGAGLCSQKEPDLRRRHEEWGAPVEERGQGSLLRRVHAALPRRPFLCSQRGIQG